jgi:hypothetical protein
MLRVFHLCFHSFVISAVHRRNVQTWLDLLLYHEAVGTGGKPLGDATVSRLLLRWAASAILCNERATAASHLGFSRIHAVRYPAAVDGRKKSRAAKARRQRLAEIASDLRPI